MKYILTDDLEPLTTPEKDFKKCTIQLQTAHSRTADWAVLFEACTVVRRLCKHHSHLLLSQASLLH